MQHASAHDLIKAHAQVAHTRDVQLVNLQIPHFVLFLKSLGMSHAGCATVDPGDLRRRPAQRVFRRLGCSAACDEDRLIFSISAPGPVQMKLGASPLRILPVPPVLFQVIDWRRIRKTLIERAHFIRDIE